MEVCQNAHFLFYAQGGASCITTHLRFPDSMESNGYSLQSDSHDSYHHIIGQGFQGQPF
jgi:hypothetical protein